MNIAIDGRTIAKNKTGVGTYAHRLVRALLQSDTVNNYYLFLIEPDEELAGPNLTKIMIVGYERAILNRYWENFILPKEIAKYNIDIFFDPAYALPFFVRFGRFLSRIRLPARLGYFFNSNRKVKYVVTIHDVISRIYPEHFTSKMRMWQRFFLWNAQGVADRVLADSQSTKRDILRFYRGYGDRVTVIYPELNDKLKVITDKVILESVRSQYSLPEKYILYVGTIEPRKNVEGIAAAYARLPKEVQAQYDLVIGGNVGWYAEEIFTKIKSQNLENRIHFIGYVDDNSLPALFTLASLFVFPSFYEGFGYPPLEAMACGVPVICSSTSSLPEAVGDAALLVDPSNVAQIADAMNNILANKQLADKLRAKGFEQVKLFNWRKCAEETLKVFEEVTQDR